MFTFGGSSSHVGTDSTPLERIRDADCALRSAKEQGDIAAFSAAKEELRRAVLTAQDLGVSWQLIGDALDMRRGAAYQRFRRKPDEQRISERVGPLAGSATTGSAYRQWIEQLHPLDGAPPL